MDSVLAIVGFIVFVILSNLADKKKPKAKRIPPRDTQGGNTTPAERPVEMEEQRDARMEEKTSVEVRPQQEGRSIFKIPDIVDAPKAQPKEEEIYREVDAAEERRRERERQAVEAAKRAERIRREAERLAEEREKAATTAALTESRASRRQSVQRRKETPLTPNELRQAVIFAEILGKPQAMRVKRRRF